MKKHLKRLPAPRTWKLERKKEKWTTKSSPGPHPLNRSMPMVMLLRDMLRYCDNWREAMAILGSRKVLVDGKIVTDPKFPVGVMDIVTFDETKESYRMLLDQKGKLTTVKLSEAEAKWKLVRIENKTTVRAGQIQLNLHDGRNILLKKDQYKTRTTLKIQVPDQKILGQYPLEKGKIVMLIGGRHSGEIAHVDKVELTRNPRANLVYFTEGFSTTVNHVFVIGKETSEITLPEGVAL